MHSASALAAAAAETLTRAAASLDSTFRLRQRAASAAASAASAARETDERFGLSAKGRAAAADARRAAPRYAKAARALLNGPAGPFVLAAGLALLSYTGLLARLLNLCVLLWFAAPLLGLPAASMAARSRARAAAEAEAAAAEAAARAGPFGWPGFGGKKAGTKGSSGGAGQVIDVEFDVLEGR